MGGFALLLGRLAEVVFLEAAVEFGKLLLDLLHARLVPNLGGHEVFFQFLLLLFEVFDNLGDFGSAALGGNVLFARLLHLLEFVYPLLQFCGALFDDRRVERLGLARLRHLLRLLDKLRPLDRGFRAGRRVPRRRSQLVDHPLVVESGEVVDDPLHHVVQMDQTFVYERVGVFPQCDAELENVGGYAATAARAEDHGHGGSRRFRQFFPDLLRRPLPAGTDGFDGLALGHRGVLALVLEDRFRLSLGFGFPGVLDLFDVRGVLGGDLLDLLALSGVQSVPFRLLRPAGDGELVHLVFEQELTRTESRARLASRLVQSVGKNRSPFPRGVPRGRIPCLRCGVEFSFQFLQPHAHRDHLGIGHGLGFLEWKVVGVHPCGDGFRLRLQFYRLGFEFGIGKPSGSALGQAPHVAELVHVLVGDGGNHV